MDMDGTGVGFFAFLVRAKKPIANVHCFPLKLYPLSYLSSADERPWLEFE